MAAATKQLPRHVCPVTLTTAGLSDFQSFSRHGSLSAGPLMHIPGSQALTARCNQQAPRRLALQGRTGRHMTLRSCLGFTAKTVSATDDRAVPCGSAQARTTEFGQQRLRGIAPKHAYAQRRLNPPVHATRSEHCAHLQQTSQCAGYNCLQRRRRFRRLFVDRNRVEGTKHEIKGAIREAAGKMTGNKAQQIAGSMEKNAGKAQKAMGKAADEVKHRHS